MTNTFMIIDDDINIVKILSTLIKNNNLGKVVEELTSGEHAVEEILFYNPDIILIDYLLPTIDGVEIIKSINERGYTGKIIMISQVEDEPMKSKAYNMGVMFFISKPINSIEVLNVIKNVSHSIELERSLSMIKSALSNVDNVDSKTVRESDSIEKILTDLGIIAESGSLDLIKVISKINDHKKSDSLIQYRLYDIYEEIVTNDGKNISDDKEKYIKSLEQRIRRTIQKALSNIAEIGLEDFYNPKFTEYSTLLFDLKQIKQEMRHLENSNLDKGRINIKKFIEGVLSKNNN